MDPLVDLVKDNPAQYESECPKYVPILSLTPQRPWTILDCTGPIRYFKTNCAYGPVRPCRTLTELWKDPEGKLNVYFRTHWQINLGSYRLETRNVTYCLRLFAQKCRGILLHRCRYWLTSLHAKVPKAPTYWIGLMQDNHSRLIASLNSYSDEVRRTT